MKNNIFISLFIILFCAFLSCGGNKPKTNNTNFSYVPQYAKGFRLNTADSVKVLEVSNPWQGASDVKFTYYLKSDADPKKMDEIKTPVRKIICLSTTHIAYVDALGKADIIDGVSGASYVSNPVVRQRIADKKVFDVGYESSLAYETVVKLQPDVIFAYGVSGELASVANKLNELGMKVVFLGDYLEETALGKAEWLMAVAAFFNKEETASEVLNPIFDNYNELADKVKKDTSEHPLVMLNAPWKDSWFIPGGNSYMVNLVKDAGGNFIFGDNDQRDSYPMGIEKAYRETLKAEYWLNPNAVQNLDELKREDGRMAEIPAFKNKKVYNNNARMTPGGGSDFWESGVMNPHIILADLVKIFHPTLVAEQELVYFHQLK